MDDVRGGYAEFLDRKAQVGGDDGFKPLWLPNFLFDFQSFLTDYAIRKGRSAVFADCGLGKMLLELVWAENVVRHTNGSVLIPAPLAVSYQIVREAEKFGIEAHRTIDGKIRKGINVTNYERLHLFDAADVVGFAGDEAGILKSFDGVRRQQITDFMRKLRYRLLSTATPSPNEYIELGTHSEALGYLGYMDMLTRFFKNDQGNSIKPHRNALRPQRDDSRVLDSGKWRFKGHAEHPFWRWACSWARALRKPSDLGFDDGPFVLPPLIEQQHMVKSTRPPDGMLFALVAHGLSEQREERRRTIEERCGRAAELVEGHDQSAVWCSLNDEGDLLEKLIPDCVQVSGKDSDEAKEEKFMAFVDGKVRRLITKGRIGGWGLNLQNCAHTVSFPTHSFEEYFQCTRRFYRFGQKRPVTSDIITTEGELDVLANMQRKGVQADRMFANLVASMNDEMGVARSINFTKKEELPQWL